MFRPRVVSSIATATTIKPFFLPSNPPVLLRNTFPLLPTTLPTSTPTIYHHHKSFTSTPSRLTSKNANMATAFLETVKGRRTYYPLSKDLTISKDRVLEIVKESVMHTPSSFNAQPTRAVVLFGAEHEKLWDFTKEVLKGIVPAESFKPTEDKINMFKAAAGSVMFFEDQEVVEGQQKAFALYADRFPEWASQADGMTQHVVWTALEAEGLGANLQHYNPLINDKVAAEWKLPTTWKLNAQLVFGGRTGEAGPKDFKPIDERVKAFGQ